MSYLVCLSTRLRLPLSTTWPSLKAASRVRAGDYGPKTQWGIVPNNVIYYYYCRTPRILSAMVRRLRPRRRRRPPRRVQQRRRCRQQWPPPLTKSPLER